MGKANLTLVVLFAFNNCSETGNSLDADGVVRHGFRMAKMDDTHRLSWPGWAPWALLGVAVTSLLTIAAALYDIL